MATPFFIFLLALVISVVSIALLRPLAIGIGLVDQPDQRKRHTGSVPLVGGVAILVAMVPVCILSSSDTTILCGVAVGMVVLGILDDIHDLNVKIRFIAQIVAVYLLLYLGGMQIFSLGNIFGDGPILLGLTFSILFTIMCSLGVVNAINMIDGIDGLAGSMVVVSALAMTILAYQVGDTNSVLFLLSLSGALAGYLIFNLGLLGSRFKIFLGDSGSMLLGLILVWFFITLSQGDNPAMSTISAGWIFGLPLVDTISVMVGRLISGNSPFKPGRDHLHYRLMDSGLTDKSTLLVMLCIHGILVGTGVFFNSSLGSEILLFWGHIGFTVVYFVCCKNMVSIKQLIFNRVDYAKKRKLHL